MSTLGKRWTDSSRPVYLSSRRPKAKPMVTHAPGLPCGLMARGRGDRAGAVADVAKPGKPFTCKHCIRVVASEERKPVSRRSAVERTYRRQQWTVELLRETLDAVSDKIATTSFCADFDRIDRLRQAVAALLADIAKYINREAKSAAKRTT